MNTAKKLLVKSLLKWQNDLEKFEPPMPFVFEINSSMLDNPLKIKEFLKKIKSIDGSCIYKILIQNKNYCDLIKKKFDQFQIDNKLKEKGIKRHVSRFMKEESECIYVGSKRKNIAQRINQHLGYGTARTYSLDLRFWFPPKIKIIIEIYMVKLDNDLLVALEQKMWANSKPMFGKQGGL